MFDVSTRAPGVYMFEEPGVRAISGVGTAIPAFIGLAPMGPLNRPTLVTDWSQYKGNFGEVAPEMGLGHAVWGFLNNGGSTCYVIRVGQADSAAVTAQAALGGAGDAAAYIVAAREPGVAGNDIQVEVQDPGPDAAEDAFTLVVRRGDVTEEYPQVSFKPGRKNVATQTRHSALVTVAQPTGAAPLEQRPAFSVAPLAGGTDVAPPSADDYTGDCDERTGLAGLEAVDEVTMVAVPDLMLAYARQAIDLTGVKAVQQAIVDHCDKMQDRMAILDTPPGFNAQQVLEWRSTSVPDSKYATLYYPWIQVADPLQGPTRTTKPIALPPSAHIAGVWARNDERRHVGKAPANEPVRGALDVTYRVTDAEQGLLNPVGVNCIRVFPNRGAPVVWGARTLSLDAEWKYINIRRLFNYIEESIVEGTQWAVFEPNDQALWAQIRRAVTAFLLRLHRDGTLFGATADQAFYVKCDEETNPPENRDQGVVTVQVGVAPVKPAEFIVFTISQSSGTVQVGE